MPKSGKSARGHSVSNPATPPPLLTNLSGSLESLSASYQSIARIILRDPEKVLTMSIQELCRLAQASPASVVKLCRSFGLDGFSDLKLALIRELARFELPALARSRQSTLRQVIDLHKESLTQTLKANDQNELEKVVQAIEAARHVEFFSVGLSYQVASTAASQLQLIGLSAAAVSDVQRQLVIATQLRKGDVAFGISCSGNTDVTVECIKVARENGATTVVLTNAMRSPLTRFGDLCLFASPSDVRYFHAPLASRAPQLALFDALFVAIATNNKSRTRQHLQQADAELAKYRLKDLR